MSSTSSPITELLQRSAAGDRDAHARLWELVYAELRRIAGRQMSSEAPGRTLQPTALVAEAYMRLAGPAGASLTNRRQFFAAAAKVMRQIRIDDARRRKRVKRGGRVRRVAVDSRTNDQDAGLDAALACVDGDPDDVLAVEEALKRLEAVDPRMAEIVVLRYFGGLTREEIGATLDIAPRTVDKLWGFARAWLHKEIYGRETE